MMKLPSVKCCGTYLERDDFHVLEAETGHDAIDILYEQTPDLAILDIMIPGIG